jgi:hypothetical protein
LGDVSADPTLSADEAPSVTQNHVALLRPRRPGPPTSCQAAVQQLRRARTMVPDGDRHHVAQSGRVKDGEEVVGHPDYDIVGKLILGQGVDDLGWRSSREGPIKDVPDRPEPFDFGE